MGSGAAAAPATAQPAAGSNPLKIVLLVLGGVVLLGIIASIATVVFVGKKLHDARVSVVEKGGEATVVTPMGTIHTTKDPAKIAEDLNVELYPGAKAIEGGSEVQAAGMHSVTGIFETGDPVEKVASFYREEYPRGIYTATEREHNLIVNENNSMITIHIKEEGNNTRITIVNLIGRGSHPDIPQPPSPPQIPGKQPN